MHMDAHTHTHHTHEHMPTHTHTRYDNEYGYSCRVVDLINYMASK